MKKKLMYIICLSILILIVGICVIISIDKKDNKYVKGYVSKEEVAKYAKSEIEKECFLVCEFYEGMHVVQLFGKNWIVCGKLRRMNCYNKEYENSYIIWLEVEKEDFYKVRDVHVG